MGRNHARTPPAGAGASCIDRRNALLHLCDVVHSQTQAVHVPIYPVYADPLSDCLSFQSNQSTTSPSHHAPACPMSCCLSVCNYSLSICLAGFTVCPSGHPPGTSAARTAPAPAAGWSRASAPGTAPPGSLTPPRTRSARAIATAPTPTPPRPPPPPRSWRQTRCSQHARGAATRIKSCTDTQAPVPGGKRGAVNKRYEQRSVCDSDQVMHRQTDRQTDRHPVEQSQPSSKSVLHKTAMLNPLH
jgi:hypothetical protein